MEKGLERKKKAAGDVKRTSGGVGMKIEVGGADIKSSTAP